MSKRYRWGHSGHNAQGMRCRYVLWDGVRCADFMVRDRLRTADLHATLGLIHSIGYASIETYPLLYNGPAMNSKALWA
jgi:hypothetical protein